MGKGDRLQGPMVSPFESNSAFYCGEADVREDLIWLGWDGVIDLVGRKVGEHEVIGTESAFLRSTCGGPEDSDSCSSAVSTVPHQTLQHQL